MRFTLKDLREYRPLCAEIERLEMELQRDKQHVVDAVQTAADFPYWLHTVPIEGDIYPYDVKPKRQLLAAKRERKRKIEAFVENVPDYKIKRALEVYYIEPCDSHVSWEMVADALKDGSNGNSIRQLVWQYVERRR